MPNLDLTIVEALYGDTQVLKIMKGDIKKWPIVTYTITTNLTNLTSDAPTTIPENSLLTVNITVNTGHYLDESSVVVMMGNDNITSTAYNNGVVTIAEVTDDVSITAGTMFDAQVEWLQGDGNAYIDTGIKASSSIKFDIDVEILSTYSNANVAIIGSRIANNNTALVVQYYNQTTTKYWRWSFGNEAQTVNHSGTKGSFNLSNMSAARTLVVTGAKDSTVSCSSSTFSNNYNLYLLAMNSGGSIMSLGGNAHTRIKAAELYDGSTQVRDYIAVRKNGVGYLFDKLNSVLYGNANSTGAFIFGNDV